jgi:acetyl-CoA carboxylase biotin carboxylase subunit
MNRMRKVLVANRGEIAVRIIRALREAGIPSVAVYSDADRGSLHVRMADEAAYLGPAPSSESYLRIDRLLAAAKHHGADAVHPGYGFLSENADFADACAEVGLTFIGPSGDSIRRLGSKTSARELAIASGVPVLPGTTRGVSAYEEAAAIAQKIGYPVMLKAAAGGGGKGMRRVESPGDLASALRDAASEAERAFGNGEVYVEKLIEKPRHIEIQIVGDRHGNLIHLGERECSIQRRHQKVIEECPSPFVAKRNQLRDEMGSHAVKVAAASGYYNAGTVEFLVDSSTGAYYFLEMNTRLQVEHPVTELVTGVDLVQLQLRIAAGERLPVEQKDISWTGTAIECRLGAEDPDNQFFPAPGLITDLTMPSGPGVRLDSGIYEGWTVPMEYDPLLAKLAVWGPTREAATSRMLRALEETHIGGIKNNIAFFRDILRDPQFAAGEIHTAFIEEYLARRPTTYAGPDAELARIVAAIAESRKTKTAATSVAAESGSEWLREGRSRLLR